MCNHTFHIKTLFSLNNNSLKYENIHFSVLSYDDLHDPVILRLLFEKLIIVIDNEVYTSILKVKNTRVRIINIVLVYSTSKRIQKISQSIKIVIHYIDDSSKPSDNLLLIGVLN